MLVESMYSVIALVFVLVAGDELCDAASVVNVYRLIQYDLSGVPFGSRLASLNHHASALPFSPQADLSLTVLMIPLRELDMNFVKEYIVERKPLGGLLFLLPQIFSFENQAGRNINRDNGKELLENVLAELEQILIHTNLPYPVYFAFEDDNVNSVLIDIKKNDATGRPATAATGRYKFVVSAAEPKKVVSPTITNIQGWLAGLKTDDEASQLPTIAIVASYDTFGAAPALSVGSDCNGSGVVALLEVARLFSLLYSDPKTRGQYNLLFGLTSGGPYSYNGTRKWLWNFDQRLLESIDYAICLNGIGSWENELWIHVSKPPENAYIKQILEVASVTFDLLLLLVLGAYLIVLFSFLVITTRGLDDLFSLFRRPLSRKVKTT